MTPRPARLKRASYRAAVEWIAQRDDWGPDTADEVSGLLTATLIADIFGAEPERVAADILRVRARLDALEDP